MLCLDLVFAATPIIPTLTGRNGCGSHSGQIFENLIEQAVEGYPKRGRGDAQNGD
jgi:hypothetical protein